MLRFLILLICVFLAGCNASPSEQSADNIEANAENAADTIDANAVNADADMNASADVNADNQAGNVVPPFTDPQPEQGLAAFAEPPPMQAGKWSRIEFFIAENEQKLAAEADGKATTPAETVYIAPKVKVTLKTDPDITIDGEPEQTQELGRDKRVTWQWNILPKSGGEHVLTARVQPLNPDGSIIQTYTREVTVQVKVGTYDRFASGTKRAGDVGDLLATLLHSWEKMLLALAAFLTAGFVVWRVLKNRGSGGSPPPESSGQQ
ncbi:MAG TPA: hypothetical protein VF067_01500 [Sphingomicrobium sp.]